MSPSATNTMDSPNPNKPFRTIEVLDATSRLPQKIACMSCIRGHRTTACGANVCRSKIFWTVKRPGRPSNSCTCRYGATGACRCVVARNACPHKARGKGQGRGRAVECRCEEQGRYCCVLEQADWEVLCALGRPEVEFFGSREALERRQRAGGGVTVTPLTPAYSTASPSTVGSVPGTPGGVQFVHSNSGDYGEDTAPAVPTTRFGMMGVGAPMGNDFAGRDVLTWDGQSPPAPLPPPFTNYANHLDHDPQSFPTPPHTTSTTIPSAPFEHVATPSTSFPYISPTPSQPIHAEPFTSLPPDLSSTFLDPSYSMESSLFDIDKLMNEYLAHQFPASICQHCGMAGCTCRSCPAVMQSFESGSWAQCCSRKHVRAGPAPQTQIAAGAQGGDVLLSEGMVVVEERRAGGGCCAGGNSAVAMEEAVFSPPPPIATPSGCCGGSATEMVSAGAEPMDLSEFLINDLEAPHSGDDLDTSDEAGERGGCCCRD